MFTGLIDRIGLVVSVNDPDVFVIQTDFPNIKLGESIAVDGVCLTVADIQGEQIQFMISPETVSISHLAQLSAGDHVNLERALCLTDRIGGHFVTGHVDQSIQVRHLETQGHSLLVGFSGVSDEHRRYLLPKGSVTVNGVSLTVNRVRQDQFEVMLIPETLQRTTFDALSEQQTCHVEFDMLVKAVVNAQILAIGDRNE